MALGYEGLFYLDGTMALCTSASIPRTQNVIESSAGYSGDLDVLSTRAVGSPYVYDWETYDGSVDFELDNSVYSKVLNWIGDRQGKREIRILPRSDSERRCNDCYWNSISLSVSEGAVVSGSISFTAMDMDVFSHDDDYINNRLGNVSVSEWENIVDVIPYWDTNISAFSDIISWSFSLSQSVSKKFVCEGNSTVQRPKFVSVGKCEASLEMTLSVLNGSFSIPDGITSTVLTFGSNSITLNDLILKNDEDPLQTDGISNISLTYDVRELAV